MRVLSLTNDLNIKKHDIGIYNVTIPHSTYICTYAYKVYFAVKYQIKNYR